MFFIDYANILKKNNGRKLIKKGEIETPPQNQPQNMKQNRKTNIISFISCDC